MYFTQFTCIVTVRNEVAKVMFLQVCVCPQGEVVSQHALQQVSRGVLSQHALQVVSQQALQQVSGGSAPGGSAPGGACSRGLLLGGACSGGGVWSWGVPVPGGFAPGGGACSGGVETPPNPTGMHSCSYNFSFMSLFVLNMQ